MSTTSLDNARIAVVGLGYVGLPLAISLSRRFSVVGYDIGGARVAELKQGHDRTGEVSDSELRSSGLRFVDDPATIAGSDIFIVAVPTPVDADNKPDLGALVAACGAVGRSLVKGSVVVFESTVYPGVTEDICGHELEAASGLSCGTDFFLGYSPERINPGDPEHTVEHITKVVAGQTPRVTTLLEDLYGAIVSEVFVARDIRTAEAAKVIENAQRDINIAFVNEVAQICRKMDLSTHDVLDAASTKWNFLDFQPGLVGGHCIGVDPFYLAHGAQERGHNPEIILAGRRINDGMGGFVAGCIDEELARVMEPGEKASLLVLGLTFKENVPDLRNSRVVDVIQGLRALGHGVRVHDPLADPDEARRIYDIDLLPSLGGANGYDCLVGAVSHAGYRRFTATTFSDILRPGGLVADIKGLWRHVELPDGMQRWQL